MKRKVCFLVFLFLTLAALQLWAQELTDFEAQRVNKRYEISYQMRDFPWGDRCDVFFFARVDELSPWFKVRALVGQYKSVESRGSYTVLWEPILDLKEFQRYEFRIFAVNKRYLGRNYDYDKTEEVGLVYPVSSLSGVSYSINGVKLESSVPLALPLGTYELGITKDNVLRGKRSVDLTAFSYIEPELEFQDGTLTLRAAEAGTKYKLNGKDYNNITNLKVSIGEHNIEVVPPPDVQALGIKNLKESVTVNAFENVVKDFSFPYGVLSLSSNEEKVEYSINETKYAEIKNLKLNPGTYIVKATHMSDNERMLFLLQETFVIVPGSEIKHNFEFKYGYLSFFAPDKECSYKLYSINLSTRPNNLKLMVGDYNYEVTYKYPYKPISGTFHISEGDHYAKTLKFIKDKELLSQQRRRDFYASTQKLFTNYTVDHHFAYEDWNDSRDFRSEASYNPIATGISVTGLVVGSMLDRSGYENSDKIKYPTTYFSFGLMDKIAIAYAHSSKKPVLMYDWIAAGFGINYINKRGTFFSNWETKVTYGGQTPIYRSIYVDGVKYKYVRRFVENVPDDSASDDSDKDRYITQSSYGQFGAESTLQYGFHTGKAGFLYIYGGVRYQPDFGGGWYSNSSVQSWVASLGDQPSEVLLPEIPKRNAVYEGLTFKIGIGIGLTLKRSWLN